MATSTFSDESDAGFLHAHQTTEEQQAAAPKSFDDLCTWVAAGHIDTVLLAVPDLQGRLKGKRYDAEYFVRRVAKRGAEACSYILATDVGMSPADGFALTSWEHGYQDLSVRPELTSIRALPWEARTALVMGDALMPDGTPVEVAPREVLRRQLDRLGQHGPASHGGHRDGVLPLPGHVRRR